jgi:TatD DNase family protein
MFFDTHCHIQGREFDADRAAVLARARSAGVTAFLLVGEDETSSRAGEALAAREPGVWAAAGLHPHHAGMATGDLERWLRELAAEPRVVAIGEIGLDYYYDRFPRPVQRSVFERQLAVAAALDLPVSVHSRDAQADTLAMLRSWATARRAAGTQPPFGVMHCYGYGADVVEEFVAAGLMVSIPGTVTFPKADRVRQVAATVPEEWLVLETDAPVLAPQPWRGRRNEPAYLIETAARVAELRGLESATLAAITTANACRAWRLPSADMVQIASVQA